MASEREKSDKSTDEVACHICGTTTDVHGSICSAAGKPSDWRRPNDSPDMDLMPDMARVEAMARGATVTSDGQQLTERDRLALRRVHDALKMRQIRALRASEATDMGDADPAQMQTAPPWAESLHMIETWGDDGCCPICFDLDVETKGHGLVVNKMDDKIRCPVGVLKSKL